MAAVRNFGFAVFFSPSPSIKGAVVAVSIVSGYGLDERVIEVRSPTETKGLFR
jgi:hypothetical protein